MGAAEADLLEEIDLTNVECLNQVRPSSMPDDPSATRCPLRSRAPRRAPVARGSIPHVIVACRGPHRIIIELAVTDHRRAPSRPPDATRRRPKLVSSARPTRVPSHLSPEPSQPQAIGKDWGNALKQGYREDAGLFCTSDDDEQLIITVPFRQLVNLTSVSVAGPGDGTAPKSVKIFVNKPNMSFDNCNKKATETLDLTPEQVADGARVELDFTQFQNIRCVSFFVETNQGGGDITNVSKIVVSGAPVLTTNMSELKKC